MKSIRGTYRIFLLLLIILICITSVLLGSLFTKNKLQFGLRKRQEAARRIVKYLGIQLNLHGKVLIGNYLYISNHQSYLDPALVTNWVKSQAVAKAEVEAWFLIGYGLKLTGTIFVRREDKASRSGTLSQLRASLRDKVPVLIFPEGTTSAENRTLPFRMGSFKAAVDEKVSVIPIAIKYKDKKMAFIGNDKFVPHFFNSLSQPSISADIYFGEPISHPDPEQLMLQTRRSIDNMLTA